jgi:hypothetical protein
MTAADAFDPRIHNALKLSLCCGTILVQASAPQPGTPAKLRSEHPVAVESTD